MAAAVLIIVGMIAPLITLKKYIVVENTFSLLSGAVQLIRDGQWFLFIVVTMFSIVLPFAKLVILYRVLSVTDKKGTRAQRYLHWIHRLGKWSMLDVFVVAILLVTVKLGIIASVELHFGIYAFAMAILLTMYITSQTVGLLEN
ncbi:MAG: paraquat-inducible protein A [Gammaproteobacteria bacterium]